MKLFVILAVLSLGEFALARGVQALRARVAIRVIQATTFQGYSWGGAGSPQKPYGPSWEQSSSPDFGIPPWDKARQTLPDGYLPSSESSDGGSPDSISDPLTGYTRGGSSGGGRSARDWDSGERTAVYWDN